MEDRERARRDDYTEQERTLALAIVAETGNRALAARRTGIPATTVWQWAEQAERDNTLEGLRTAIRFRLAHEYVSLAARALAVLGERLSEGDPYVDLKSGEVRFMPVRARDAAMIASICTDKHALITGALQGRKDVPGALQALAGELISAMKRAQAVADPAPAGLGPPGDGAGGKDGAGRGEKNSQEKPCIPPSDPATKAIQTKVSTRSRSRPMSVAGPPDSVLDPGTPGSG